MPIRKTWPSSVIGATSTSSRTQPVPSMATCVVGSAITSKTASIGTGIVSVALTEVTASPGGRGRHRPIIVVPCEQMEHWLTVEVFSGPDAPAAGWLRSWHDWLVESAIAAGAVYWDTHEHVWGVVLELAFADEALRDAYREHAVLRSALDAAPD